MSASFLNIIDNGIQSLKKRKIVDGKTSQDRFDQCATPPEGKKLGFLSRERVIYPLNYRFPVTFEGHVFSHWDPRVNKRKEAASHPKILVQLKSSESPTQIPKT